VAVGEGYECHSCGATFAAGLVRVPRAFGRGGEDMAQAALLPVRYPEVAVIEEGSLAAQSLALSAALPQRPLVLGGCCCAHVGALEGLAARGLRLGLVWLDAHGDLNTPESSRSGNAWGMPLRSLLDVGTVAVADTALVGARNLDPGEKEFIASSGLPTGVDGIDAALEGTDAVYVALDLDVLDPGAGVAVFMPEPGGLALDELAGILRAIAGRKPLAGAGFTGLTGDLRNLEALERLSAALGL
jgi:arginase